MADNQTHITLKEGQTFDVVFPNTTANASMSVTYSMSDGTALGGNEYDYDERSGSFSVPDNSTKKFTIAVNKDSQVEEEEIFYVDTRTTIEIYGFETTSTFRYVIHIPKNGQTGNPYEKILGLSTDKMLDWAITKGLKKTSDKALALEAARAAILEVRDLDSTNTNARDAEYYLIGALAGYTRSPADTLYVGGTSVYNGLVAAAKFMGLQKYTRADPDKPNAPPGGKAAAWKGFLDGRSGDFNKTLEIYNRDTSFPNKLNKLSNLDDENASASAAKPAAAKSVETFKYDSKLDLHNNQSTTIKVYQSSDVPRDSKSRVIVDHDYKHALTLGAGNDTIFGGNGANKNNSGAGNDMIFSLGGNDILDGGAGIDTIDGGAGNDKITGGSSKDLLYGGTGSDTFIYRSIGESKSYAYGQDMIMDFRHSQRDKIDLHLIDANTKAAGNQSFHFIGDKAFGHKAGELRAVAYGDDTMILGDVNGNGVSDITIFLHGHHALQKGDFIL